MSHTQMLQAVLDYIDDNIKDDLENIEPDMTRVDIPGGLYAIFSTPPV